MQERNHIRPFDRPCFFASSKTSSPQRNSSIPFCRTCFLPIQLGAQSLSAARRETRREPWEGSRRARIYRKRGAFFPAQPRDGKTQLCAADTERSSMSAGLGRSKKSLPNVSPIFTQ